MGRADVPLGATPMGKRHIISAHPLCCVYVASPRVASGWSQRACSSISFTLLPGARIVARLYQPFGIVRPESECESWGSHWLVSGSGGRSGGCDAAYASGRSGRCVLSFALFALCL